MGLEYRKVLRESLRGLFGCRLGAANHDRSSLGQCLPDGAAASLPGVLSIYLIVCVVLHNLSSLLDLRLLPLFGDHLDLIPLYTYLRYHNVSGRVSLT